MKTILLGLFSFAVIIIISCNDSVIGPEDQVVFPNPDSVEVSYFKHVSPFFRTKCSMSGCHGEVEPAAGRSMTTYYEITDIMENPDLIVKGYPDYSVLVQLMDGRLPHLPPFRENYFTQNQIDGIRAWIEAGAPNN